MSGILERIEAKLDQLLAQPAQVAAPVAPPAPVLDPAAAFAAKQAADFAAFQAAQAGVGAQAGAAALPVAPATNVSGDQLQALIMPHIDNAAIKEALGAAMRAAGVNALPEAQPHQYGDLYARFQAVLAAHGVGGTAAPAANTALI